MAEHSALEEGERAVVIAAVLFGAAGLLYVGVKLYRGISAAAGALGGPGGLHIPTTRDYIGPSGQQCHEEVGVTGTVTTCGPPPPPPGNAQKSRTDQIAWAFDHGNGSAALAALKLPGSDPDLENTALLGGAERYNSVARKHPGTETADDLDWYNVMAWWGVNRAAPGSAVETAGNQKDFAMLADFATSSFTWGPGSPPRAVAVPGGG